MSRPRRPTTPKQSYDVVCSQKVVSRVTYRVMASSAEAARQMVEGDPNSNKLKVVSFEDDIFEIEAQRATPSPKLPPPRIA